MFTPESAAPPRRSSLIVVGTDAGRLDAARARADQVVWDLADVAPSRKDIAREQVVEALGSADHGDALVGVRVNPIGTIWAYRDVIDVVERAAEFLDGLVLPRVELPSQIAFVDTLLGMIEQRIDLAHHIDIEIEIATAAGLAGLDELALASERITALVLDEAGVLAALGVPAAARADDALASIRTRVLTVARAIGTDAVVAPPSDLAPDDLRATTSAAQALGVDGARTTDPPQVAALHSVFTRH